MSNYQAPFEYNPYHLPIASTSELKDSTSQNDSSPQEFPSYSPSTYSSSVRSQSEDSVTLARSDRPSAYEKAQQLVLGQGVDDSVSPDSTIGSISSSASSVDHVVTGATSRGTGWDLDEDAYLLKIMNENKASKGAQYWQDVEEEMKVYWFERRGSNFSRSKNALKTRGERFRFLEEVGVNPLNYVPRPWTAEEDAKLLSLKADHQHMNKSIGIDYSKAIYLFAGRPRFDLRERKNVLTAEAKRKVKQEEEKKKREIEIEQYKRSALSLSTPQTHYLSIIPKPEPNSTLPLQHSVSTPAQHPDRNFVTSHPSIDPVKPTTLPPIPPVSNRSIKFVPAKKRPSLSRFPQPASYLSNLEDDSDDFASFSFKNRSKRKRNTPISRDSDLPAPRDKKTKVHLDIAENAERIEEVEPLMKENLESGEKEEKEKDVYDEGIELIRKMRVAWDELDDEWDRLKRGQGGEIEMGK